MFGEWLVAAATTAVLGSSTTPPLMKRIQDKLRNPNAKERTFSNADIACVAAAVAARESTLATGAKTHGDAVANAYSARATALQNAYAQTGGNSAIRDAVKGAWSSFKTSVQSARKAWQSARDGAWATFRTAVKSCKSSAEILDTANATSEPKGE